ncbi:unnamed protein product [Linum trigynum]
MTNGILLGIPECFVACYACSYHRTLREKYKLKKPLVTTSSPTSSAICVLTAKSTERFKKGSTTLTRMTSAEQQ